MTLAPIAGAVLYTIFLWWFSTGAILWLDRQPKRTYRLSLVGATAVAIVAVGGLIATRDDSSAKGAVIAFTCALGVWGWHEFAFLTGLVAGPRTALCPPDASGWRRFTLAASTLIYHEIALALTAAVLVALTWGQPNAVGAWTFLILFASRISAKLNLFLGVPNFTDEFFPDHLRYLTSYLRKSRVSGLFPLSMALGGTLAATLAWNTFTPGASAFEVVGGSLLLALTVLALMEHAFMVTPLPDAALWRWMLPTNPNGENG